MGLAQQDTHAALHVLQLWQDVQREAVSLPSRTIASVHEVAKSQHEAEDPQNTRAALESLETEANETRSQRSPGASYKSPRGASSHSPCTLSEGFQLCAGLR